MGKASSAKKVARASRAGGHGKVSNQRSLTFPVTIAAVSVLGLALGALREPQQQGHR